MTIWNEILEMLKTAWTAFVESGLAEKGVDMIARIITYDSTELIQYMWDFINTLFPNGVML